MKANVAIKTNVEITAYDSQGRPKIKTRAHNTVVDQGLNHLVEAVMKGLDAGDAECNAVGYGSSGTTETTTDTALGSVGETDVGLWSSGTVGVCYVERTFTITGAYTAREAGLFGVDKTTAPMTLGTMVARATFSDISLVADDALHIKWTITITDA